ncbi:hypothetical protein EDB92DRAFT_1952561 [Lactarius akahatsu]|uniref:Uncharacterized protein n=1 Tax=Lactarius akahatsu TaxID=416441 RepID=A0AAD4L6D4_9AGAM|nr:hypothetical protein EDB92DRAFT_1952561 [Lactarius akahatsu]
MAAIHARFPNSGVVKRIQIVHQLGAQQFFSQWPDAVRAADGVCDADIQLSTNFCEDDTRNAFLAFSARLNNIEVAAKSTQDEMSVVRRRTDWFSPSKFQATVQHLPATTTDPQPLTRFIPHDAFSTATPSEYPVRFPLPPHRCNPIAALGLNRLSTAGTLDAAAANIGSEFAGDALGCSHFSTAGTQDAAATARDIGSELVGNLIATTWDIGSELISDGPCTNHTIVISNCIYSNYQC